MYMILSAGFPIGEKREKARRNHAFRSVLLSLFHLRDLFIGSVRPAAILACPNPDDHITISFGLCYVRFKASAMRALHISNYPLRASTPGCRPYGILSCRTSKGR